jgi:hypothetical protein
MASPLPTFILPYTILVILVRIPFCKNQKPGPYATFRWQGRITVTLPIIKRQSNLLILLRDSSDKKLWPARKLNNNNNNYNNNSLSDFSVHFRSPPFTVSVKTIITNLHTLLSPTCSC